MSTVCETFQELADLTWHRLQASVATGLPWSEETNTETVLATLAERHPKHVRLQVFSRREEALNGSDWEWWVGAPGAWFGMRVQAKRLHRTKGRFVRLHSQKPRGHASTQMDTLIKRAAADGLTPAYCFYVYSATWPGDAIWLAQRTSRPHREISGCLIAHASAVRATRSEALTKVGAVSLPWHYLVCDDDCRDSVQTAEEARAVLHRSAMAGDPHRGLFVSPNNEEFPLSSVQQRLPTYLEPLLFDAERNQEAAHQQARARGVEGILVINTSPEGTW